MIELVHADFAEYAKQIPDGTIDLIYTDPPYPRSMAVPCFELLAKHSHRLLTDGGSLVTIVPHYLLPEVIAMMDKSYMKYRWIYNMDQEEGSHARMAMGIEVCWKPLLHYVKRAYPSGRGFLRDKAPIPNAEKALDPWQQSVEWARYYVKKLAHGTVLDPFVGTGTTGVVCKELGLDFIGLDKNPEMIQKAIQRCA